MAECFCNDACQCYSKSRPSKKNTSREGERGYTKFKYDIAENKRSSHRDQARRNGHRNEKF
jgi:hypothetical protein